MAKSKYGTSLDEVLNNNPGDYKENDKVLDLADRLNKQEQARPGEYKPGDKVNQALDALNQHQAAKPGDYVGRWDEQINGLLEQVLNRPAFNYDFNADPLYQQYKNQYVQQGKQAMQDTVAQASALTGGYGNSYAAAAGSGAYQQYLNQLNGVIPELYDAAYARYRGEGSDMMDKLGVLQGMDNTDYGRYRDKVSDWESMLDYLTGRYDTERNFDYGTYRDKVSDWESMRDYLAGRYDTERNFDYGSWRDSVGDWESMRDYYQNQQNWQKEFDFQQAQWNYKVAQEAAARAAAVQRVSGGGNDDDDDEGEYPPQRIGMAAMRPAGSTPSQEIAKFRAAQAAAQAAAKAAEEAKKKSSKNKGSSKTTAKTTYIPQLTIMGSQS
jgi:hypothetical protein